MKGPHEVGCRRDESLSSSIDSCAVLRESSGDLPAASSRWNRTNSSQLERSCSLSSRDREGVDEAAFGVRGRPRPRHAVRRLLQQELTLESTQLGLPPALTGPIDRGESLIDQLDVLEHEAGDDRVERRIRERQLRGGCTRVHRSPAAPVGLPAPEVRRRLQLHRRLDPAEAQAFAQDVEDARKVIPPLRDPWR